VLYGQIIPLSLGLPLECTALAMMAAPVAGHIRVGGGALNLYGSRINVQHDVLRTLPRSWFENLCTFFL
jgi:hypothetical protein